MSETLTIHRLSILNVERSDALWPQCREWEPRDWLDALDGELGEARNILKKMRRDGETPELWMAFHREIADILHYADLTISMTGGRTCDITAGKWNEMSECKGYGVRI